MESLFNQVAESCSKKVTKSYSTSFSLATGLLAPSIRQHIHNIYGFVRFADEIVDTFHNYDKELLLDNFEKDFYLAYEMGISLNPILHSFQMTVHQFNIDLELVDAFLQSMRMDLDKKIYENENEYKEYIYGSADVVGLMCLKVFVNGDNDEFLRLKASAMRLGSAFQKVNFLRDLKNDIEHLDRSYFPGIDFKNLNNESKRAIINEIEEDFHEAFKGIQQLPATSKLGVYTAFVYYKQLLYKLKNTPPMKIMEKRIRVSNYYKFGLLVRSYFDVKLNLI